MTSIKSGLTTRLFLLFTLAVLANACYEDVEGCLDVNAANYDLDADVSCPDNCCEFPEVSIAVRHLYGGERVDQDSFYLDGAGNAFRINRLRYYWTDIQYISSTGDSIEPQSELEIGLVSSGNDTVLTTVNDNLDLIELSSTSSRDVGTFRTEEAVVGLSLLLGVEDDYQRAAPSTAPSNHPLAFQAGRLHFGLDTGYVQFKFEYELVQGNDTITREVAAFGNQPMFLDFGGPFLLTRGFDVAVICEAEVDLLLAGLNLAGTEENLRAELLQRFPAIFLVVPE